MNQFKSQKSIVKIATPPAELILERCRAFGRGDYGLIYDTFHSGSNFRRQFSSRGDYVAFGQESLAADFRILDCRILADDVCDGEARVLFLLEMSAHGIVQVFAELAWLRREQGAWRYHRGLKITDEDLPENPDELGFADFEALDQRLVF